METALEQVQRVATAWPYLPAVRVVPTAAHLPGRQAPDTVGLFHRGEVFVVAAQPPAQVPRILAHEAVHATVRAELGPADWRAFMGAVAAGARAGDEALIALRQDVRATYLTAHGEPCLTGLQEADEVVARAAEWALDPDEVRFPVARPRRAVWALLAGQIARRVFYADVPVGRQQLLGMLVAVEHRLRTGSRLPACQGRWYSAAVMPSAKPLGPSVPARDLAESQQMLDRSKDWSEAFGELGHMAMLVAGVLAIVGGVGYWALLILGIVRL
jgi:hypothetical protein